ncbi:MAG: outer membrane beta-barrel protein [Gemmatimonadales bacterium]
MKGISKRISLALAAVAAVAVLTSTSSAQSSKALSVGISGGAAIPFGDFGDFYTTGYNGTVSLMFKSVGTPLGIRIDGMYNKLNLKDDAIITIPGSGTVESASIAAATANLVYSLPGTGISPYLIGGGGIYSLKVHGDNFDSDTENKAGINGGIGASFPLSGFNTFIEARFHHVFTDGSATQFIPVTFGISF